MAKDTRIAFRTSGDLKERLQRAAKKLKLGETTLAEKAVEAAVEFIEEHGGIWFPLRVVPQDFKEAGEKKAVGAGGLSSGSTRYSTDTIDPRLNEPPPAAAAPGSRKSPR